MPLSPEEYEARDATALAELVARGEVSAAELVEIAIARIEERETRLRGIMERDFERARAQARALPAKDAPSDAPFRGVPFLVKDNIHAVGGLPYHNGSRVWRGHVHERDSTLVARFRAAGLIVLGTTKVPELSLLPTSENHAFGTIDNPVAPGFTAGGSSSGSAAHVAARSVPMAHGTDGAGSIRIPASACGLYGLKPTRARTPNGPFVGEGWHGASVGHVLTRSVRDSARLLDAVHGSDLGDAYEIAPPARPFAEAIARPPRRLRIAVSVAAPNGARVDPVCREAALATAKACADLGHDVEEAAPPVPAGLFEALVTVILAATAQEIAFAAETTGKPARRGDTDDTTWLIARLGHALSGAEVSIAIERLHRHARAIAPFFERFDMLITPTLARPPVRHGDLAPGRGEALMQKIALRAPLGPVLRLGSVVEDAARRIFSFIPFTPIWNVTGQPAASLPTHRTADGLPVGVQLVGRFGDEAGVLALSAALEAAGHWRAHEPRRA